MDFQEKKIALVLGGTNPHIALIENLKGRGYYTVLVDYLDNSPAKKFADQHIQKSTLDLNGVLEIALRLKAKLVISTCIDQANVTACYVAEKLNLPAPYSYETALKVTNKGLMKKLMLDYDIPTSNYKSIEKIEDFHSSGIDFPAVVKPMDSNGSKGVRLVNSIADLELSLLDAKKISRTNQAIVEEFKDGVEVQADYFVQEGKAYPIMLRKKNKLPKDGIAVLQSIGSSIPTNISSQAKIKLQEIANLISKVFSLKNTPLFLQTIINGNDVNVIEFAPRVGGGVSYNLIKQVTDFDVLDSSINSFLGQKSLLKRVNNSAYFSSCIVYGHPGIFGAIEGFEQLNEDAVIEDFFLFKVKGMEVDKDMSARSRIGAFLVKADTREEMLKKMRIAVDTLEVYDLDGKKLMKKDIYDNFEGW